MTGFTSGAARRRDIEMIKLGTDMPRTDAVAGINECHAATERVNPILDSFRDEEFGHDAVFEWLYQLGHVWTEWLTEPFPIEGWDGRTRPVSADESAHTGEDAAYWHIHLALRNFVWQIDGVEIVDYEDGSWGYNVTDGHFLLRRVDVNDRVTDRIIHAARVLERLLDITTPKS